MPNESTRTVWVALAADLGSGLPRLAQRALTGSTAMAAEAAIRFLMWRPVSSSLSLRTAAP